MVAYMTETRSDRSDEAAVMACARRRSRRLGESPSAGLGAANVESGTRPPARNAAAPPMLPKRPLASFACVGKTVRGEAIRDRGFRGRGAVSARPCANRKRTIGSEVRASDRSLDRGKF
eukprot:scaffold29134_cov73-Phaeocystis_antarctica.AAC.2